MDLVAAIHRNLVTIHNHGKIFGVIDTFICHPFLFVSLTFEGDELYTR